MPNKKTPDTNVKEVVTQELSESQKSKAQLKAERKAAFVSFVSLQFSI
jgi:hypothetical protein